MIKSIIFDYDGVIVDSFSSCHDVYKVICESCGVDWPEDIVEFRKLFGYNYIECLTNLGIKESDFPKSNEIYAREIVKRESPMSEGIKTVLEKLSKKYELVIASATYLDEIKHKLRINDIEKYFPIVMAQKDSTCYDEKSDMISSYLKQKNLGVDEVIYVGDRDIDLTTAKQAGLKHFLMVEYGWGHTQDTSKQEFVINKPIDLLDAIKKIDS